MHARKAPSSPPASCHLSPPPLLTPLPSLSPGRQLALDLVLDPPEHEGPQQVVRLLELRVVDRVAIQIESGVERRRVGEDVRVHEAQQRVQLPLMEEEWNGGTRECCKEGTA